ncbi:transmembrane protein 9B-like [Lytechinus pictus]|uniref:transmembrane protein 9B-like n=1 Tax=Lytechinus pictus TaxID=7653 RepID=UPI0030B9BADB
MSNLTLPNFIILLLFVALAACEGEFGNVRCKCICPAEPDIKRDLDIQVVTVSLAEECSCELVMKRNESDCLRCECKYESRNITTIEVVIFLIIVVVICLFIYLIALAFLDPEMFRSKLTEPQMEDTLTPQPDLSSTRQPPSYLGRVGSAQRRWRSQVQQQRENIFDRHTILS